MQGNRLRSIGEDIPAFFGDGTAETPAPASPLPPRAPPNAEQAAATNILMLALKALSQRALVAVGNLFVLLTAASAWWLWMTTLPQPSIQQLVGLALYGCLILALNYLVLSRTRSS
jgi:hypothetical protein